MFLSIVLGSEVWSGLTRASMMTVVKILCQSLQNTSLSRPREKVTVTCTVNFVIASSSQTSPRNVPCISHGIIAPAPQL